MKSSTTRTPPSTNFSGILFLPELNILDGQTYWGNYYGEKFCQLNAAATSKSLRCRAKEEDNSQNMTNWTRGYCCLEKVDYGQTID